MNRALQAVIEDEIEKADRLILATEKWGKEYSKDPETHAKLIKLEARLTRIVRKLFREKAEQIERYMTYSYVQADYQVHVDVIGSLYEEIDSEFIKVAFDTVALMTAVGAEAGENIYKYPLGIRSTDAIIQDLTTERLAFLIGKSVDKSGALVDNPKADYRISDKTRTDVAKSIQTSISLGEDKASTINRLKEVINNPRRAEIIAQTETVNAYGQGILAYGGESGATGKESKDVSATDVCAEYAGMGIVPIDFKYGDSYLCPAYHTGCRCGLRLVYANEYNPEGK